MADEVSPSQARARQFDVVRRGYDRAQVDVYIEELSSLLDDLQSATVEVKASALAVGIDDPEALAKELGRIGGEVSTILEASRAAAEGLRKRAAKDAEKWRTKAKSESRAMLEGAIEQSQSMRAAAWNEGTSMLMSAIGTARAIMDEAQEDAMFMRAEAERDALRLTSDARRDKEEALRAARLEGESIIAEARAESDGVLAAAQKQADAAQDRARALEDRRSELLGELEAARASISHLEDEIDSRRQALESPEEPEWIDAEIDHLGMDVGSVKIVAPSRAVALKPVDTDEIVAEVVAMRFAAAEAKAAELEHVSPQTVAVISPPQPTVASAPEPAVASAPEPAVASEPEPAPVQPAPSLSPPPQAAPPPTQSPSVPSVGSTSTNDDIGSLFARLRDEGEKPEAKSQTSEEVGSAETEESESEESESEEQKAVSREPEAGDRNTETPEPVSQAAVASTHNAALKQIKKVLVELQNETLEALRADASWLPSAGFTDRFNEPFVDLSDESGSQSGKAEARAFASDLEDAVTSAIEEARTAGKGERAVAAQASKVFRLWRTDEAERRLRSIS